MRALLIIVACMFSGCGSGTPEAPVAPVCRVVHMYGDSITHQAGQAIEEFLPCYTVINHGSDGTMAYQMPMPTWDKETVYTISYGTNECLNNVSLDSYRLSLNHILNAGRGYKIVLEAPWLVVDPRCNWQVEQYRQIVVDLGKLYNVPVATLDLDQSFNPNDGIHIPPDHMRERANLVAAEILKLR